MSSRKYKRSKNNKDKNKNQNSHQNDDNTNTESKPRNEKLSSITFKFPGRWATLSCSVPFNEKLTLKELQRKIRLTPSQEPPDAKKLFELYFMDEIYPFLSKNGQDTVNTKKDIGKAWDLQTNHTQKIYQQRSDLLNKKWLELKGENEANSNGKNDKNHKNNKNGKNNHHHHIMNGQTVIFKYYSVHRHIFITQPSKKELLSKISLSNYNNPPTAKQIFEIYYYDDILPFLKKSDQQSMRGKKESLSKLWQIQVKSFKKLYEERAKLMVEEYNKLIIDGRKYKKSKSSTPTSSSSSSYSTSYAFNTERDRDNNTKKKRMIKMDCRLIRTLLNFLLFFECTNKENCFMLLVSEQNERYKEYEKFKKYLADKQSVIMKEVSYIHLKIAIGNFEPEMLRLHTFKNLIKLCFVHKTGKNQREKEEEFVIFELRVNKLLNGLDEKIDDELIKANIDDEGDILNINIPIKD